MTLDAHWTSHFRIAFHDAGADGHTGIVALANLLQQTAGEHAEALDVSFDRLFDAGLGWALARQKIVIAAMPAGGQRVAVATWPSTRDTSQFRREFVVRGADGAELAVATCTWSLLDLASRKARQIPDWIGDAVQFDPARPVAYDGRVVARLRDATHECVITPRLADIDMNGHVNNAHLFGWTIDALPREDVGERRLAAIDMMFRAECTRDDAPISHAGQTAPGPLAPFDCARRRHRAGARRDRLAVTRETPMTQLRGKTLFVTGASRGIGKAIALKAAADGANIAIAAKSAEPHPKLPGTIHTAADEMVAAGGQALALVCDVRDDDAVYAAVDATVERFGGIDILINNASAIALTGTTETPMKRYDLMHQINTRGTYLSSQACIPHLKRAANPHILNIAPPLDVSAKWFAPHVAYTMAKYGMSLCAYGMAEELRGDGIAVNSLWPRTAIWTAALVLLGGPEAERVCRTTDIMADAAYAMLMKPAREFTGNFCIDDEVLSEAGVTDFSVYRHADAREEDLQPDFFLSDAPSDGHMALVRQMSGG